MALSLDEQNEVINIVNSIVKGKKVSALDTATSLNDADYLYLTQGGTSKKVTKATLATAILAGSVYWESLQRSSGDSTTLINYLAALTGTTSNDWQVGSGTAGDKTITLNIGAGGANPKFRWSDTNSRLEYADDGVTFIPFGSVNLATSLLTGLTSQSPSAISATDTVLVAFGKLQAQIDNLSSEFIAPGYSGTKTYLGGFGYIVTTGTNPAKQTWLFVSDTDDTGTTPGTNANVWLELGAGSGGATFSTISDTAISGAVVIDAQNNEHTNLRLSATADTTGLTINNLPVGGVIELIIAGNGNYRTVVLSGTGHAFDSTFAGKESVRVGIDSIVRVHVTKTAGSVIRFTVSPGNDENPIPEDLVSLTVDGRYNKTYNQITVDGVTSTLLLFDTGSIKGVDSKGFRLHLLLANGGELAFSADFANARNKAAMSNWSGDGQHVIYGMFDEVSGKMLIVPQQTTSNQVANVSNISNNTVDEEQAINTVVATITSDAVPAPTGYNLSGVDAAHFNVFDAGGGVFQLRTSTVFDFETPVDTGGNNVYDITLAAVNSEGTQATPTAHQITVNNIADTLNAPTGLAAVAGTDAQTEVDLSWTDTNTSPNETAVLIERKIGVGGTYTQIASLAADTVATTDTGLTNTTEYYYRVRVTDGTIFSPYSNEVNITTAAPGNLAPTASSVQVTREINRNILLADKFIGTTINTNKWTIDANTPANVEISQNNALQLIDLAAGAAESIELNRLVGDQIINAGNFAAVQCNLDFSASSGAEQGFGLFNSALNYALIYNDPATPTVYRLIVVASGSVVYNPVATAITHGQDVRVTINAANLISFEYWNGSSWVVMGSHTQALGASVRAAFMSESTTGGPHTMTATNFYMMDEAYTEQFPTINYKLVGSYSYADNEGDLEGVSTFRWLKDDDGAGTNKAAVGGATAIEYIVPDVDEGKYFYFEVTPVAQTGTSPGAAVESSPFFNPITSELINTGEPLFLYTPAIVNTGTVVPINQVPSGDSDYDMEAVNSPTIIASTGFNGIPAWNFTAANQAIRTIAQPTVKQGNFYIWMLVRFKGSIDATSWLADGKSSPNPNRIGTYLGNWSLYSGTLVPGTTAPTVDVDYMVEILFGGAGSYIRANNVEVFTGDPGQKDLIGIVIGNLQAVNDGKTCEIAFHYGNGASLSVGELTTIRNNIAARGGITI